MTLARRYHPNCEHIYVRNEDKQVCCEECGDPIPDDDLRATGGKYPKGVLTLELIGKNDGPHPRRPAE